MAEYGIFLLKTITIVVAILMVIGVSAALSMRQKKSDKGHIEITHINDRLRHYRKQLAGFFVSKAALKKQRKAEKKSERAKEKAGDHSDNNVFVLSFKGDMQASAVASLREEVTAILAAPAKPSEVVLRLESPGGAVHGYGLAASQLVRLKDKGIPLTVCIDNVAASGGYMMACVADKILAAPFAYVGSIGVLAQVPNIHRLLKKHDVDVELHTAGEYKQTLTLVGENTEKGREKFRQELQEIHQLFKGFVSENRPSLDIEAVSTGEFWLGLDAKKHHLVDGIQTSDQYLLELSDTATLYEISYKIKKNLVERMGKTASLSMNSAFESLLNRLPF